jgi:hypothetical protein
MKKASDTLGYKEMMCMNSDPEHSKYWKWAPQGGCTEMVKVDSNATKVLCSKCTMRMAGN